MRILEFAGLHQGAEYRAQEHFTGPEGNQRPDIIIDLPEGRSIVIDSKLSLVSWTEFVAAGDEATRTARGKVFTTAIRTHLRQLADKRYQDLHGLQTLDFVLMYIPLEAAFIEALARDPDLYRDALDRNIALVGPSTLLATMRTVAAIWRYEKQEKNALQIAEEAGRMLDKLVGFLEKLDEVGQRLDQAGEAWRLARERLATGSGNVLKRARHLVSLGAKATKRLPAGEETAEKDDDGEPAADGGTAADGG
jgi:DNA recombination protein RmuC